MFQSHNGQKFLKFRDITLVPYEPKLIDINMLTPLHVGLKYINLKLLNLYIITRNIKSNDKK